METEKLIEIKKNLAMLPMLQKKIENLRGRLRGAEGDVRGLLERYRKESLDVERLEKDSFSTLILKNFGRYESKLTKESEEMLAAKLEYDRAAEKLNGLKGEEKELENRISELNREKRTYEEELERREGIIKADTVSEAGKRYAELEAAQDALAKQLAETGEALAAAERVYSTAAGVMGHLDSAENWATFDVWTRGGIFSHIAKYEHIDSAKQQFNLLNSQLQDLHRELGDLGMEGFASLDGIDSTTRAIDFWFDNIFTDMRVRERIREDNERVSGLRDKIRALTGRLEGGRDALKKEIAELEQKKGGLALGLQGE